jgi:hypothetical protein
MSTPKLPFFEISYKGKNMLVPVTFKTEKTFKKLLQERAEKKHRSVSSFVINAVATYIRDHHKIDWHKSKKSKK